MEKETVALLEARGTSPYEFARTWCKAAWCGGGKEELLSHRKRSPLPHKGGLKFVRTWRRGNAIWCNASNRVEVAQNRVCGV